MSDQKIAMKVSVVSIFINLFLSLLKLFAGIFAHSGAMVSDAVHSASDVVSTIIVIIGVKLSGKQSDHEHPYGHERLESIASILLAGLLLVTGAEIGYQGILKILSGASGENLKIPGLAALLAAIISLLVKEWMFWYTRATAKKINSDALMADAWHHRSDALSSVGSFIGILGTQLGFPILDPAASVIICLFIFKAAYDIFKDAVNKLVDHSCDEALENQMRKVVLEIDGVDRIDLLQTRLFGSKIYADVEIAADETLSLAEAHNIAEQVHHAIEKSFAQVKHCMVHVNPANE